MSGEVVAYWTELFGKPSAEKLAAERISQVRDLVRYEQDKQVVALSTVERDFNNALGGMYEWFRCSVHPAHRRKNLARQLLSRAMEFADRSAVSGIIVFVENEVLEHARGFEPLGFRNLGRNSAGRIIQAHFFDKEDENRILKQLASSARTPSS